MNTMNSLSPGLRIIGVPTGGSGSKAVNPGSGLRYMESIRLLVEGLPLARSIAASIMPVSISIR